MSFTKGYLAIQQKLAIANEMQNMLVDVANMFQGALHNNSFEAAKTYLADAINSVLGGDYHEWHLEMIHGWIIVYHYSSVTYGHTMTIVIVVTIQRYNQHSYIIAYNLIIVKWYTVLSIFLCCIVVTYSDNDVACKDECHIEIIYPSDKYNTIHSHN